MALLSPCKTLADLPLVGNTIGDLRVALNTGLIYKWDGGGGGITFGPGGAGGLGGAGSAGILIVEWVE